MEFKIQNAKSDLEDIKDKYKNDYEQRIKSIEEKNRDATIKHKEAMANSMEHADAKQKRLLADMELNKKKFDNENQKLEENHNKVLCI